MWLLAEYSPVAFFSLKTSTATSSGARSNLCPTMYAVKMALIAAAFDAGEDGEAVFRVVKDLAVRFRPPKWAVINNVFVKVQREPHDKSQVGFQSTVGYREYVYLRGNLTVAIEVTGLAEAAVRKLERLLAQVNYFGKRGGFMTFQSLQRAAELGAGFSYLVGEQRNGLGADVIVQFLDDFGPQVSFAAVNTYSDAQARLDRDRVIIPVALPYRLRASSRTYTFYERAGD